MALDELARVVDGARDDFVLLDVRERDAYDARPRAGRAALCRAASSSCGSTRSCRIPTRDPHCLRVRQDLDARGGDAARPRLPARGRARWRDEGWREAGHPVDDDLSVVGSASSFRRQVISSNLPWDVPRRKVLMRWTVPVQEGVPDPYNRRMRPSRSCARGPPASVPISNRGSRYENNSRHTRCAVEHHSGDGVRAAAAFCHRELRRAEPDLHVQLQGGAGASELLSAVRRSSRPPSGNGVRGAQTTATLASTVKVKDFRLRRPWAIHDCYVLWASDTDGRAANQGVLAGTSKAAKASSRPSIRLRSSR